MEAERMEKIHSLVKETLDKIRPYLQSDGGDIEFVDITDDLVVKVKLTGACHDCPYRMQTLKGGVEQALMKEIPEITGVIAV
ncbi:MAG: NifU family protein [Bacteroidales bacterium]|jgi:Fe-S cluster biogenesis protein NfuA|nr:NifU family protein [Bacteroidales bacterium]